MQLPVKKYPVPGRRHQTSDDSTTAVFVILFRTRFRGNGRLHATHTGRVPVTRYRRLFPFFSTPHSTSYRDECSAADRGEYSPTINNNCIMHTTQMQRGRCTLYTSPVCSVRLLWSMTWPTYTYNNMVQVPVFAEPHDGTSGRRRVFVLTILRRWNVGFDHFVFRRYTALFSYAQLISALPS